MRATPLRLATALLGVTAFLVSCSKKDAVAVDCTESACGSGGSVGSGGAQPFSGGASSNGGAASTGGVSDSGGAPSSGGGMTNTAGSLGTAPSNGGSGGSDASAGSGGATSVATYTLVVDAPLDNTTVHGTVTVSGHAPGFLNVEVWDATHAHPPLAQVTPAADGSFSVTIDTASLPAGATTWTVYAWDAPAGAAYTHTANVPLDLTISSGTGSVPDAGTGGTSGAETVGTGDISAPAAGPAPTVASKVSGASFTLVKNWDFGTAGTIKNTTDLISEFNFHDQFGTIANGTNYGAVIVAPNAATAIHAPNLGLPNDTQPVEDPAHPTREWTPSSILAHVRPLSPTQSTVSVSSHNAGNGSLVAKWTLPNGGKLLGKDILWETRARMPAPLAAYWFAFWTSGKKWDKGAEMDVLESFGSSNIYPPPTAFHVNSVGGTDSIDYSSWPAGLTTAGVPTADRDLTAYHTWSWLYRTDDTYVVYYDGITVQTGTLHWTVSGTNGGEAIDMDFLFDLSFGHTQIAAVNITLPASSFPLTYEVDYSRVYLR
jgi:hypothetical protein